MKLQAPLIFYDPTRRRWRRIVRTGVALGIAFTVVSTLFIISLLVIPVLPRIPGVPRSLHRAMRPVIPTLPQREKRLNRFLLNRARRKLLLQVARQQQLARMKMSTAPINPRSVVAGFYATWQSTGLHSLRANADKLTHVMPAWVHLSPDGSHLSLYDWDPNVTPQNRDVVLIARQHGLAIAPVFDNAQGSRFDPRRAHRLLADPSLQSQIARQLVDWLQQNHFHGVNVDLENLYSGDYARVPAFLRQLRSSLKPAHLQLSVDLEASNDRLNWKEAADSCDFVVLMAYDEHSDSDPAGPIASLDWYRAALNRALKRVPPEKLVVGLGNYAYDWTEGKPSGDDMTYQEALITARDNRPDEAPSHIVDFDPVAMNPTFTYEDDAHRSHEVWMLDAVTAADQWRLAQERAVLGAALWVLGSEDPSVWSFLQRDRIRSYESHDQPLIRVARPSMDSLSHIHFPYDVEFIGKGEVLQVDSMPHRGKRNLEIDPQTGLCTNERYERFPTSYIIKRSGYRPGTLALTFDDGPSDPYTEQMLDQLRAFNVPATFFVIGENAEKHPFLIERMWNEGHEIGNHTFTHPNLGAVSDRRARLELNATGRALQSILGRSTRLFRPPYNADAEPTSAEEVHPVALASMLGYLTVGELIDPQDWNPYLATPGGGMRRRTVQDIARLTLAMVHAGQGNAILLHDGGGDRSQTFKALSLIVPQLKRERYRFVLVSDLLGVSRDAVMPPVTPSQSMELGADRVVFEAGFLMDLFLRLAFLSAIALGIARVVCISLLALLAYSRERKSVFDQDYHPSVSVLIAAYNEQKVIAATIHAVLENGYDPLEVIVVDDGSKDGTAEEIDRCFADHPQVRLLRQLNQGKATALNNAIQHASGEILICLDADTLFAADTISKLIRRFANPQVGAVAGNVKVGNRINLLTRWQAIEYITSQNLDRRAYALLNAVTVVPGAVGAWRKEAVTRVGGYHTDTLAEDMDLTWRLRRAGWRVDTDSEACGFTEAPDTLSTLFRQRFRWAFGTLQCLWKHHSAVGKHGWFGWVMLPSLWLFQIAFQVLSPLVDLQIAWTLVNVGESWLTRGLLRQDWQPLPHAVSSLYHLGFMYALFFVLDLIGGMIAFTLDRERMRLLWWLFWQRFVYRQLMYAVVLKSLGSALQGLRAGWGKLQRKGTAKAGAAQR